MVAVLVPAGFLLFYLRDNNAVSNIILQSGLLIDSTLIVLGVVLIDWVAKRKHSPHLP